MSVTIATVNFIFFITRRQSSQVRCDFRTKWQVSTYMHGHSSLLQALRESVVPVQFVKETTILPPSKPQWSKLESLGFALAKLHASAPLLFKRIRKRDDLAPLRRFLPESEAPQVEISTGLFAVAADISMANSVSIIRILEPGITSRFYEALPLAPETERGTQEPELAKLPPHLNARAWSAFLRLRPLREFWELELSRNHWNLLTDVLPDAWFMEGEAFPPNSVIPRLDIQNWGELPPLADQGESYEISPAWDETSRWTLTSASSSTEWETTITAACAAAEKTPFVITKSTNPKDDTVTIALYRKSEKRVDPVGVHHLAHGGQKEITASRVARA